MTSVRSILVVDVMGGLGDLVLALPSIHALALSHPGATVSVAALAPWHTLLERDPLVHEVLPIGRSETAQILTVVADAIARHPPDLAVTTNRRHGLPELLERTCGWAVTDLWRSPPPDELVDLRYLRLLAAAGAIREDLTRLPPCVQLTSEEVRDAGTLLSRLPLAGRRPILLFPDSGMAVKRWPLEHWRDLIEDLIARGDVPIVISQDGGLAAPLVAAGALTAPALSVRGLAAFCAATARAGGAGVGGDTGPVRLATAVGMQCVGLYGPTLASRYGMRPERSVDLQGYPGCGLRQPTAITEQPCWWSADCPLTKGPDLRCMTDVAPAAVGLALSRLA